jgi:hypothetical protein
VKIRLSTILNIVFIIAAVSVLFVLYQKSQSLDVDPNRSVVESLRTLKQIDTAWNEDVLKTRLSINTN